MLPAVDIQGGAFPFMYVILFALMRATWPTHLPFYDNPLNFNED